MISLKIKPFFYKKDVVICDFLHFSPARKNLQSKYSQDSLVQEDYQFWFPFHIQYLDHHCFDQKVAKTLKKLMI